MQIGHIPLANRLFVAPMAGVTDRPFRQLCKALGAGYAVSEMVTSRKDLWNSLKTSRRANHEGEPGPIAVQIAGTEAQMMAEAAVFNIDRGAQIIDINMGCPAKKVCNKWAGSALMQDEALAVEIAAAVVEACAPRNVPVTLKMRTGWCQQHKNAVQLARQFEGAGIQMLTVHGRTREQGYKGQAEYDTIAAVKAAVKVPVVANGDITSPEKARAVLAATGAMLFLGPTGVGKTALAKALAASWFGSEKALLKFDMSEYQEQHTTARLLGAPPGYLGHDEGGQLTEAVRRRPYSVVLFDEIEKAHPDIQNILLQILEDGQLTDAMGRKADFRNTIVLLTSNLGARFLAGQSAPLGFAAGSEAVFEKQSAQAIEEAKKWFRPELVGRLDELIVFRPLAEDSLCAIAEKLLGQLEVRAARNGYQLTHTPRVGAVLAARARSPYGARELRRQVDRAVEQALANQIASGTAHTGQHWTADCTVDGAIVLEEGEVVEQTIG